MKYELLAAKKQVETHKYLESEKCGQDIGYRKAWHDWLINHWDQFIAAYRNKKEDPEALNLIQVRPRRDVQKLARIKNSTNPFGSGAWACISISTARTKDAYYSDTSVPFIMGKLKDNLRSIGCVGVLSLVFGDITPEDPYDTFGHLFTESQAKQIVAFADSHSDVHWLVHCDAGISRSGAIGTWLARYQDNIDERVFTQEHKSRIQPNSHVLSMLMEKSGLYAKYAEFWEKTDQSTRMIDSKHNIKIIKR